MGRHDGYAAIGDDDVDHERLLDAMSDAVVVYRGDTIRYVNAALCELLGYAEEEIVEADSSSFVHPGDRERLREYQRRRYGQGAEPPDRFEARLLPADGGTRRCEFDVRVVTLDGGPATLAVLRTVPDHRSGAAEERKQLALENLAEIHEELLATARAIVRHTERDAVKRTVCDRLAATPLYEFAWFDDGGDELAAVAGTSPESISTLYGGQGPIGDDLGPAKRALRDDEVRVTDGVPSDGTERGRVVAIPVDSGVHYGTLLLFTDRVNAFGVDERAALDVFGELTGFVMTAIENRELLTNDTAIELVFEVTDPAFPLLRVAGAVGGRVTLEGVHSGESVEYWVLRVDDAPSLELIAGVEGVSDVRWLNEKSGRFQVGLESETSLGRAGRTGVAVTGGTATPESSRISLELAAETAVDRVSEAIRESYPDAELLRKHDAAGSAWEPDHLLALLEDELTDRQWRVLEVAYYGGYFEWPRDNTGEEIAETLGIAQPTFHNHLRNGERELLRTIFEPSVPG